MINILQIDPNAIFKGLRAASKSMGICKNTLKAKIKEGLIVARKDDSGCTIIMGYDIINYFKSLPVINKKEE
jgi:hypothetical protein